MLTLIVPGLLWPRQALADLTRDLPLPALATLLGRGRLQRGDSMSLHACIAAETALPYPLPAAALRRAEAAEGAAGTAGMEICLDPVHLRFEERTLIVDDPQQLALDANESHALTVSLASTFAALGEIIELSPQHWNLRLHAPAPAFTALPEASARAVEPLPLDTPYAPWRHALNEAQILLHDHPVNQARNAAGRPVINSLWPWGGGILPPQPAVACRHTVLWSDEPLALAIAHYRQMESAPTPLQLPAKIKKPTLAILDTLSLPARSGDGLTWRDHLTTLESQWFAPALAALKSGRLNHLHLIAIGTSDTFDIHIGRIALWKFWQPPLPLTTLATP